MTIGSVLTGNVNDALRGMSMKEYIIKIGDEPDIMGNYGLKEKPKELVRCGDCKFIDESVKTRFFCGRLMRCVDADWFCADGERVKK